LARKIERIVTTMNSLPTSRRHFLLNGSTLAAALSAGSWSWADTKSQPAALQGIPVDPNYQPTLASDWLDVIQTICADEVTRIGARPTVLSRQMCIPLTAMFDAWSRYDAKAVPVYATSLARRPAAERDAQLAAAISYAAYRTMADLFPGDLAPLDAFMKKQGLDPANTSTDPATGSGLGNLAATATLTARRHDGANQHGDETGSATGKPYSDYTYYSPVNPVDKINDPDRWQPIAFTNPANPAGPKITPGFLTPHWYRVKSFSLTRPDQFRPGPPPLVGTDQLLREAQECIDFNANLTPANKAIVEFMRDGPRSTGQSGHWLKFAQMISRRDKHNLDRDIQLYFAVSCAAQDAFIAAWETKRHYDSSRPWTLIHHLFAGKDIKGWGGPDKGTVTLKGENWHPYSPSVFVTPPFPGYVSGHSCVSAACAKVLQLFTGSDHFGAIEIRPCCVLTETPGENVRLPLPTFTATADMAGLSRVMGGYHIQADNTAGLKQGREVAEIVWAKAKACIAPG
jgi:PAP2 superfamily